MTFLQPFMLMALPLVALPILIHLINQRRHRTKKWAAMMFLMQAKRMSRGMARLRHILIMLMRMLAVAGFIFAISRPLATGWLGLAGARSDTAILLLDRSASMEQQDLATGESKRSTGVAKIADLLKKLGQGTQLVLIESTENRPQEIESVSELSALPQTSGTVAKADIPAMLEAAEAYMEANQTGLTDIWICSDLRINDWNPEGGRWETVVDRLRAKQGVRVHLLAYDRPPEDNLAVTVSNVKTRPNGRRLDLLMDINIKRQGANKGATEIPLELIVNGNRTVIDVELTDNEFSLQGHSIELDADTREGWGLVELPNDGNPADNQFYFVFAEQPEYKTAIVTENPTAAEFVRLAVTSPVDPTMKYTAAILSQSQLDELEWDETAMIVWQAPLPNGTTGKQLEAFSKNGGTLLFFPPENPNGEELFQNKWGEWHDDSTATPVATWRGDSDLLSHSQSGTALSVGEIQAFRYCSLTGEGTALARLNGGQPFLSRASSNAGSIYFCSTLPDSRHSNLLKDGVVFYVMIQRALVKGAAHLGSARHAIAGTDMAKVAETWKPLSAELDKHIPSTRPYQAGVYEGEDTLIALNRPIEEDVERTADAPQVQELFSGLDFRRIDDHVGKMNSLASEIWRSFVIVMGIALLIEALLCLPPAKNSEGAIE